MKKHSNTFLIASVLIFSFLFIGNVKAVKIKGINVDQVFLEGLFDRFFEGKTVYQVYGIGSSTRVFHKEDFPYVVCYGLTSSNPGGPSVRCNFLTDYSISSVDTNQINITSTTSNKYYYTPQISFVSPSSYFNFKFSNPNPIYLKPNTTSSTISYTNFDVYQGNNLLVSKSINYDSSGKKNVSFHLNGGNVMDFSNPLNPNLIEQDYTIETKTSELGTYLENIIVSRGSAEFLGWYYDSSFTEPYTTGDTLSSDINLYAKWETPKTFNFHLNGGYVYDPDDGFGSQDDFSISLYNSEIEEFFTTLEVKRFLMLFDGWYYDYNYAHIFHIDDNFEQDTYNLYAKWRYEDVNDLIANTTFNEYTFNTDYQYAIINRGDNGDSIYLGLPFSTFNLEIYEYNESTYRVKETSSACLTPIYKKDAFSIYDINTLYTNNQEVLILPRALFDNLDPNNFEDPNDVYHFYLTDNAYVSYTNDLSQADIVDSNGDHISINLQDSYELSQQYHELYSDPENIFAQVNIFLNKISKITSAIKGIFEYLFNSFNSTIQGFIIFIIVVVFISAIMRIGRKG